MYFLDLATQGVRGFSPNARVALYPGYLVLQPRGSEPIPLSALVMALLYPDGSGVDASLRIEGMRTAKGALMLQGNDSVTYRIVHDLGGSCSLQRLNKDTHRFEPVTQEPQEMAQLLRTQVGMPSQAAFEQLFALKATQLPSRNVKDEKAAAMSAALAAPAASAVAPDPAAEQKLGELSKELELAQKVEQLQSKQDELASELYALESALQGTQAIHAELEEAEKAWTSAPTPQSPGVPADILERLDKYPELAQKRDAALEKLTADREAAESRAQASAQVEVVPLHRDPRFIISSAIGTACLVAGALLHGSAKYVAMLDVPAFGAAALFALQWVDGMRGSQRSGRQ